MAAPELEIRPSQTTAEPNIATQELVEHPDAPEAPEATLGEYIQPSVPPMAGQVDDKGQTILAPAGTKIRNVPYTPKQIQDAKKISIISARRWLGVLYELLTKRFAFLGSKSN